MRTYVKLSIIALVLVAYSCGTAKTTTKAPTDPFLGDWSMVTSSPDGELKSTMKIIKNEDATYTGTLASDRGSIPMEELKIENSALTSNISFEGMQFELKGNFMDNEFKGDFFGMGSSFPVLGTKGSE